VTGDDDPSRERADGAASGAEYDGTEVAVVGMAGRFPGARDLAAFWRNLRDGVDAARRLSDRELELLGVPAAVRRASGYVPVTAQLADLDCFDAAFFGFEPDEAEILDPQQRVLLELAWEALESAGYDPEAERRPAGVFAGATLSTYLLCNLMPDAAAGGGVMDPLRLLIANAGDSLATRISYKLNLKGPSFTVQCACSTALVAVHLACASLLNGECDLALAGAASINVNLLAGYRPHEGGMLSPEGRCRAFDAGAAGILFGHGGGVVALKRLSDALAGGDTVRAVLRGSAVNNDGSLKVGYSAPSVEGQAEVLTEAWAAAGIDPATLSYVEAHGTGTRMGDPIEVQALARAFRPHTSRRGFCGLGSVKTNVGHLDAAAGIASLIKTVLALEHRQIPPTLHVARPNPEIDFAAAPVRLVTELEQWPAAPGRPRRAGVSAFGIGGTNAHLVVEEAPAATLAPSRPWDLLVLSARSAEALERATDALAAHLEKPEDPAAAQEISDVAYTLQLGRRRFPHRRTLVCARDEDAAALLRRRDRERVSTLAEEAAAREAVFLLPGPDDLHPQAGRGLYRDEAVFRREIDRCAGLLAPHLGRDLRDAFRGGPEGMAAAAADGNPEHAAVARARAFAIIHSLARLWMHWGVRPAALLGHGQGGQVAACIGEGVPLADALRRAAEPARSGPEPPPSAAAATPTAADDERFGAGLAAIWREPGRALLDLGGGGLAGRALHHPAAPADARARLLASLPAAGDPRPESAVTLAALGRLWLLGLRPDWTALHDGAGRRRVPLPTYPFERQRFWRDAPGAPRPLSALTLPLPPGGDPAA